MASFLSSSAVLLPQPHSLASPSAASQRVVLRRSPIKAVSSAEPQKETPVKSSVEVSKPPASSPSPTPLPKKPVYSMKKGQIVRADKEKYLNSINYLSVGHPPFYKGLDYIYEDRGEVLDMRIFETGEHALVRTGIPGLILSCIAQCEVSTYQAFKNFFKRVAWVGIPTAPAWLPTDMLIKSEKLDYERI